MILTSVSMFGLLTYNTVNMDKSYQAETSSSKNTAKSRSIFRPLIFRGSQKSLLKKTVMNERYISNSQSSQTLNNAFAIVLGKEKKVSSCFDAVRVFHSVCSFLFMECTPLLQLSRLPAYHKHEGACQRV